MRLKPFSRLCVVVCSGWISLLLAETPGLHSCAVHRAPVSAASVHHDHGHESGSNGGHKKCSCLGAACCAVALAPDTEPTVIWSDGDVKAYKSSVYGSEESLPCGPEFTIPFANGPPSSPGARVKAAV